MTGLRSFERISSYCYTVEPRGYNSHFRPGRFASCKRVANYTKTDQNAFFRILSETIRCNNKSALCQGSLDRLETDGRSTCVRP